MALSGIGKQSNSVCFNKAIQTKAAEVKRVAHGAASRCIGGQKGINAIALRSVFKGIGTLNRYSIKIPLRLRVWNGGYRHEITR